MRIAGFFQELWGQPFGNAVGSVRDFTRPAPYEDAKKITEYLLAGHDIVSVMGSSEDVLGSRKTVLGGDSILSDNEWIWRGDLWFYVWNYHVQLPEEFLERISLGLSGRLWRRAVGSQLRRQQLATGVAISLSPVAAVQFWTAKDEDLPTWLRESRTAVKETGKALIAYDQWGENPSRAAGAVTFNVITTVFTGGTGGAVAGGGKAALAAKALSTAGKVSRFVDPMTYVFKGTGFGLTKIGDAMAGLKGLGTIEIPPLPG